MTEKSEESEAGKKFAMTVNELAHDIDDRTNLYHRLGWATLRTVAGGDRINPQEIDRSLYTRVRRAELLKKLTSREISREESHALSKRLDAADRQFAKQALAPVELGELGEQKAEKVELFIPKDGEDPEEAYKKPPIFIIPAYSGDLYGIETLLKEAAVQTGRRVIALATPESHGGFTSDEFSNAVASSESMDPYVNFFKAAIDTYARKGEVELRGYSTGGVVTARILSDPRFQERVTNAVAIAPAGCTNQSMGQLGFGIAREMGRLLPKKARSAGMSIVTGPKEKGDDANVQRRKQISDAVLNRMVLKESEAWENIRVREGGRIMVIAGEKDHMVMTKMRKDKFVSSPNPQYEYVDYKGATHLTPLTHADYTVSKILELQSQPQVRQTTM